MNTKMYDNNRSQQEHYIRQYSWQRLPDLLDVDLHTWCRTYPLQILQNFFATLKNETVLVVCAGLGPELLLFVRHGIKVTATDLVTEQLQKVKMSGLALASVEKQNAEALTYQNNTFDYGFVNAGLHHLKHPHVGLAELLRCARKAVVFIEAQDTIIHMILGKRVDFEAAGNHVYRWTRREIDKYCLSAQMHTWCIKTALMPVHPKMAGVKGSKMSAAIKLLGLCDKFLSPLGNRLITIMFKEPPSQNQLDYLCANRYRVRRIEDYASKSRS